MSIIILDTSVIITYPKLLGITDKKIKILVPINVIDELKYKSEIRNKNFNSLIELIEKGSQQNTIEIVDTNTDIYLKSINNIYSSRLGHTDTAILAVALKYKETYKNVKIATFDIKLFEVANKLGIDGLNLDDIQNLVLKFDSKDKKKSSTNLFFKALLESILNQIPFFYIIKPKIDPLLDKFAENSIEGKIRFFEKKEITNLVVGIFIGALIMLIALYIYNNLNIIISNINIWGTIILIIISGILLFIFREKQRLSYGVFEFLIGIFSIYILFSNVNFNYDKINFSIDFNIRLIGGLYIMVRGQDNIVKALKNTKIGIKLKNMGIGV